MFLRGKSSRTTPFLQFISKKSSKRLREAQMNKRPSDAEKKVR